ITNQRLAADLGSDSKWSLRANLSYLGGAIDSPFSKLRPDYRAATQDPAESSFSGSIGAAYRVNKTSQIRLTTGFIWYTPLYTSWDEIANNSRINFENKEVRTLELTGVAISYVYGNRFGNWMISPSFGYSYTVNQNALSLNGNMASASLGLTAMYNMEGSGLQPGFSLMVDQFFYTSPDKTFMFEGEPRPRAERDLWVVPVLEYQFNDKVAWRIIYAHQYRNTRTMEPNSYRLLPVYISTGIGITPVKKIWIYPNVQFIPEDARAERTNFGISAILNVF
ncbi:MAG: hypothetical protein NZ480_00315, partial [Bdellovibrionaceae bacterium]|nr:hypothetical protein [Pseudobdellovibrionaceae bacterium]